MGECEKIYTHVAALSSAGSIGSVDASANGGAAMFGTTLMFGQAHGVIGAPAAATATKSVTDVAGLDGLHAKWGPFTAARKGLQRNFRRFRRIITQHVCQSPARPRLVTARAANDAIAAG
jgi:hypothetical protein